MLEYIKDIKINIIYLFIFLLLSKYDILIIILNKLYLFNYTSLFILLNIIGLYLFIKNISFEINLKFNIKYN
jgi:hypothetical protein